MQRWRPPVSARLIVHGKTGVGPNRNYFNTDIWWPAAAAAGIPRERRNGMHALRHYYASVLLDAGESIKALAAYLDHSDAGFTPPDIPPIYCPAAKIGPGEPSTGHSAIGALDQAVMAQPAHAGRPGGGPSGTVGCILAGHGPK